MSSKFKKDKNRFYVDSVDTSHDFEISVSMIENRIVLLEEEIVQLGVLKSELELFKKKNA